MHQSRRGNILFLILLAVVLFAALSYAVTSSLRGGGKDASGENMQSAASDMLNQFAAIDSALIRMQMSGNLKPEQISFATRSKTYAGTYFNGASNNTNCTDDSCRLFTQTGGGVTDRDFEKYGTPNPTGSPGYAPGYWQTMMLQWPNAGTNLNDVVMQYLYMKPAFCDKMRELIEQPSAITLGGSLLTALVPANWDNTGYTVSSNASSALYKTTAVLSMQGTGDGQYCQVLHLLFAR